MANFLLILALGIQVAVPKEMTCLGFIHTSLLPMNAYISGTEQEGAQVISTEGNLVYISGPGISALKAGDSFWVSHPEGIVRDRLTQEPLGYYYEELGSVRIETVASHVATAQVVSSCKPITKGDLILPAANRAAVSFSGELSNRFTPFPSEGLTSSIIVAKDDLHELAAGHFCFIGVGARDGVKTGDRFTIYRESQPFNPRDFGIAGSGKGLSYEKILPGKYPSDLAQILSSRNLPPQAIGDLVVVDVFETTAAARIVNSHREIHLGDIIIRR